jgi:hypothetical protein
MLSGRRKPPRDFTVEDIDRDLEESEVIETALTETVLVEESDLKGREIGDEAVEVVIFRCELCR